MYTHNNVFELRLFLFITKPCMHIFKANDSCIILSVTLNQIWLYNFRKEHLSALIIGDLIILVLGITHAAEEIILTYPKVVGSTNLWHEVQNTRRSRSVLDITSPVLKSLIKTATEVPTASTKYRKFLKSGNARDAYADFYKLKPSKLKVNWDPDTTRASASGFVGDTDVQLRIRKRWPTILIYHKDVDPS